MRKLLIAEDNETNRSMLHKILEKEYEIIDASNGKEALEILHKRHKVISAVLLDIRMPEMDGFEVLDRMRSNAVLSQIPVIVATGAEEKDIEVKALALGANDFVTKPYNAALILHCLRNTINLRENASIVNAIQRDKLTGLLNRETFFDKVSAMLKEHEPGHYVMSCFDIDGFKVINDQYGAEEGDRLLKHIGHVARARFAELGGIAGRISADNFAALYPVTALESDFIKHWHELEFAPADAHSNVSFSVGRYIVNDLSLTASAIYDRANMAKQSVKGRYDVHIAYFSESMREKLLREQAIISEMDAALMHREFEVWLQPQFNHTTGALIGAEALVRWRHPDKGLITPAAYIPVFEQNGFIYELDKYVWQSTCAMLRRWLDEGQQPIPVSVNVSRYDIFREDFFEVLTGLVEHYELPIDLLRVEVTESAFARSTEQIIAMVKRLMSYGFTVEIDDFGSGYSSLNTLKDVPATVLKLDMRLLENTGDSRRGGNIVESVVRMAKWLGMSVIAEGVETLAQADYLKTIGCSYIQGFLYATPMPVSEFEELAHSSKKEQRLLSLETVENLDNNAFWDPASMDTLIFNSYVGGACIFEYHNGSVELLRANESFVEMLGSSELNVQGMLALNWTEHISKREREKLGRLLETSIAAGGSVTGEIRFTDLPGCPKTTYLRSTMRVIAVSGDHSLVYCTNENTTAQRQAEKKEQETSEHLRTIMANINGGVTATVIEKGAPRILFANDQFYAQLGYTREEFEREVKSAHDCIHPDDRARVAEQTLRASEAREPFTSAYRIIRRDGTVRWLRNNISITTFADEREPVQLAVANDITELREAEDKERRMSEQMQAIMGDVGSGITAAMLDGDDVSFILANEKYYEIVGYTREQYEKEVRSAFDLIHPDDRVEISELLRATYASEGYAQANYRIIRRDGKTRWVRVVISSTRFTGDERAVQLCIFTDITAERAAERALRDTDEQLRFLNEMAHDLLAQPDCEKGVENVLRKLLSYFDGNRAYIFEFDTSRKLANNTYEFCAEGVSSEKERLQDIPLDLCQVWFDSFRKKNYINIESVTGLPDDRPEKELLLTQNIESLIAVPLRRDGKLLGLVGIDDPRRRHAMVDRLVALGDYIAVMLTRRDLEAKIVSDNKTLVGLMNDTPGGFVRMRVLPDGKTALPIYYNDGFRKLVGMSVDELDALYGGDAMAGVHPDDVQVVREAVDRMLTAGEAWSARYRLKHGRGGYIWIMIYGRMTRDETGDKFLNIYYTDMSERMGLDEKREELLENLPCGAGIYEVKDGAIRATYLNKRYRAYLNREIGELTDAPVLEVVHPDDRRKLNDALRAAFIPGRQASCDIRIMDGRGGYIPFRLVGSAMEGSDKSSIYVTFTPISQEELSYSEMLPVALSAVISSSDDLAFVKDRNRRFVCCSERFARFAGLEDAKDIVGKTDYDIIDKKYADVFFAEDDEIFASGKAHLNYEAQLPSRSGLIRYSSTSKYPLLDSSGGVIGIYCVTRDITEQRETDSQLKLLTDNIPGGLASYECPSDALTPENISLTYFNDGFCKLFGYGREEYGRHSSENLMGLVFDEDRPRLVKQLSRLLKDGTPVDCTYRAHTKDGGHKWISHKAVIVDRGERLTTGNAVLLDVTEMQESAERLRISEEEHRLAMEHSGNIICRYSVADSTLTVSSELAARIGMHEVTPGVPYGPVERGEVSQESAKTYIDFYEAINNGSRSGSGTFQKMTPRGWRWFEAHYSTIFDDSGAPASAVVSFYDVTEQLEKEAVYRKWQQSLSEKAADSYTLFRCNISKDASFDMTEGSLLRVTFDNDDDAFNDRTLLYANRYVLPLARRGGGAARHRNSAFGHGLRRHQRHQGRKGKRRHGHSAGPRIVQVRRYAAKRPSHGAC